MGVVGVVVSTLAYCTGDHTKFPNGAKISYHSCARASQASMGGNGGPATKDVKIWPTNHDVNLTSLMQVA